MSGHGHVKPNPDGSVVRCGGPGICDVCSREAASEWWAMRAELDALRAALDELVAVEDEKDQLLRERLYGRPHAPEYKAKELDHRQRRTEAWRAARALLDKTEASK